MPLSSEKAPEAASSEILLKATLILVAVGLNALEFFIPRIPFLPWLKPGLANLVTIIWIVKWGTLDALAFSLLRVWIAGFYFGFSFITLALALSGGIASVLVMGLCWSLLGKRKILGLAGMGILGALAHNSGQILAVYALMAHDVHLFYQAPFMLVASVAFGGFTGWLAAACYDIARNVHEQQAAVPLNIAVPVIDGKNAALSILLFCACIGVMLIKSLIILSAGAVLAAILTLLFERGSIRALTAPIRRFWLLFIFIAAVYLFLSYGRRIPGIPFITYEGLTDTISQWLRLWIWLQLSVILGRLRFNDLFLTGMDRLFPAYRSTIAAGILALEKFPAVLEMGRGKRIFELKSLWHSPVRAMAETFERLYHQTGELLRNHSDKG